MPRRRKGARGGGFRRSHPGSANVWFGGLENLALERVGFEPVRYVANINKYFVILTRLLDERARRDAAIQDLQQNTQR